MLVVVILLARRRVVDAEVRVALAHLPHDLGLAPEFAFNGRAFLHQGGFDARKRLGFGLYAWNWREEDRVSDVSDITNPR